MAVRFADHARGTSPPRRAVLGFSPTTGPSVGLVAVLATAAIGVAALVSPDQVEHGPVLCPFRRATGLPCPGCGLTRSWVYLLHGRVQDALAANPFGIVTLVAAVALLLVVGAGVVRRRPLPSYADLLGTGRRRQVGRVVLAVVVVGWIGFGVARLLAALVG